MNIQEFKKDFEEIFGTLQVIFRSPGRINIIGEHTDYNAGFVLPASINKSIYVGLSKRNDERIHLYAKEFNQYHSLELSKLKPSGLGWPNYVLGVVDQLYKSGFVIGGFNLYIDGDIPSGAGISSSAALECATAGAINQLFSLPLDKQQLATLAQQAEHVYAGVKCGIMDQFASIFGMKDKCFKLDCRSLEYQYFPLKLEGYKLVLLNTNVKHSLSSSAYNKRREQCEQGVAWIQYFHPEIHSLRDATIELLDKYVKPKNEDIYTKCRFVVEENQRVNKACEFLQDGKLHLLGELLYQTHEGLKTHYEVSCDELDFLVEQVKKIPEVLGARMMGGGFGGCTLNIIEEQHVEEIVSFLQNAYFERFARKLSPYVVETGDGLQSISFSSETVLSNPDTW